MYYPANLQDSINRLYELSCVHKLYKLDESEALGYDRDRAHDAVPKSESLAA